MMNDCLTIVERQLVEEVLKQHGEVYDRLADQLDRLRVIDREPTGVGAYINLSVIGAVKDETINTALGFVGKIEIDGVPLGLGCELVVKQGRMHYIELITYADDTWDGDLENARIIPAQSDWVRKVD